jgi:hypothetical protein
MDEPLIELVVAFAPGTSGRFIAAICHMLRDHLEIENIVWRNNSGHDYPIKYLTPAQRKTYKKIMPTHAFPNLKSRLVPSAAEQLKLISEKADNCKTILIGISPNNSDEIINNILTKNKMDVTKPVNLLTNTKSVWGNYTDIIIPKEFAETTLVIMYSEIYEPYNDSFVALEKISKFLDKPITESILKNYKSYVDGRNQMLQENNIPH